MFCLKYHTPRVEYDAYRTDLEELNLGPRDAATMPKIELSQQQFQIHRAKYERMRNDVSVKLKFLEENKVGRGGVLRRLYIPRAGAVSSSPPFLCPQTGEGIAQAADPVPQRHRRVLRRKPAAAGTNTQRVPHQVENARRGHSILAGRALIAPFEATPSV